MTDEYYEVVEKQVHEEVAEGVGNFQWATHETLSHAGHRLSDDPKLAPARRLSISTDHCPNPASVQHQREDSRIKLDV